MTVYEDARALIGNADVDIVDICVPTPDHADIVCAALAAGKHVFCEKPLCRDATQMKRIVAAAKKAKTFFNVGLCVRAWPEYRHAYEYFKSGKAGKMKSATFKRISPSVDGNAWQNWFMDGARSGGALLDLHVHDADEVTSSGCRNPWLPSARRALCRRAAWTMWSPPTTMATARS